MAAEIPFTINPSVFIDNIYGCFNPNIIERQQFKKSLLRDPALYNFLQFDTNPMHLQLPRVLNFCNKILYPEVIFPPPQPLMQPISSYGIPSIRCYRNDAYCPQLSNYQTILSPDAFEMRTSGHFTFHGSHALKDLKLPSSESTDLTTTENKPLKSKKLLENVAEANLSNGKTLDDSILLPSIDDNAQNNSDSNTHSLVNSLNSLHMKTSAETKTHNDNALSERPIQHTNPLTDSKQSIDHSMHIHRDKHQETNSSAHDAEKKRKTRNTRQESNKKNLMTDKHKAKVSVNRGELPYRFRVHNRPLYEKYQEAFKESVKNGDYWKKRAERYIRLPDSAKTQIFPHKDDISLRLNVGLFPQVHHSITKPVSYANYKRMRANTLPGNYQDMAYYVPEMNNIVPPTAVSNQHIKELQHKLKQLKLEMRSMKRALSEARNFAFPGEANFDAPVTAEKDRRNLEKEAEQKMNYVGTNSERRYAAVRKKHSKSQKKPNFYVPEHRMKILGFPPMNNFECTYIPTESAYYMLKSEDSVSNTGAGYNDPINFAPNNSRFESATDDQYNQRSESDLDVLNNSSSSSAVIENPETEKILREFSKWYFKRNRKSFGEHAGRVRFKYYSAKNKCENDEKKSKQVITFPRRIKYCINDCESTKIS